MLFESGIGHVRESNISFIFKALNFEYCHRQTEYECISKGFPNRDDMVDIIKKYISLSTIDNSGCLNK